MNELLNTLVIYINDEIRSCKVALETEEKGKGIAFLQGYITGYRLLLGYLKESFNFTDSFLEDNGEAAVDIKSFDYGELLGFDAAIEGLKLSGDWTGLLDAVKQKETELKSFLLNTAENARDLFFTQASGRSLRCYEDLFRQITSEHEKRRGELFYETDEIINAVGK